MTPAISNSAANLTRDTTVLARLAGRSIVLVGMMGAGKSSIGKRVAERLGLSFIDADAEIETAAGKSIPEIFAEHGEPYFREGEKRVIARILEGKGCVLATGGGAFMSAETRARVTERAVSVWLKAEPEVLMHRVRKRSNRPLLRTADPEATLRALLAERHPIYALADITVLSREVPHEMIVGEIIEALATLPGAPKQVVTP